MIDVIKMEIGKTVKKSLHSTVLVSAQEKKKKTKNWDG